MFCRYCGNELPDDAKFCNGCGKPVSNVSSVPASSQNESTSEVIHKEPVLPEPVPMTNQDEAIVTPKKKKRKIPLPAILAIIVVAVIGIIFIERNSGTQDMIKRTIEYVSDQSEDRIVNYYGDYFGINKNTGGYVLTTCYSDADVTWSGNDVTIKWPIEIKIQRGDQPTYTVDIILNAETNFMRSSISHKNDWKYSFDVPDQSEINSALPENEEIVSMRTLFTAFDSNGVTAINTYGGQYLNVSGIVEDIHTTSNGETVVKFDYYYYSPNRDYSFDQMDADFIFADSSDPNLSTLEKDKVAIITGYLGTSYNGYSLEFEDCRVYGGEYSGDNYVRPDTEGEDNYSDSPEYDDYGNLTDNSPNLQVNLSEPYGYYEKADGTGGFSIEYISDDGTTRIEYYTDGQPGYYGGQWFDYDFSMGIAITIDFSSDNVLDITDGNGNILISLVASDNYITLTAPKDLYGVPTSQINGDYYCKIQSSILQ